VSSFFSIFKPAPHIEEISDEQDVKALYKYWRLRILYSMFIGYALYYFTRKSFTFAMPGLIEDLGFDKSQLGLLGSILSLTYGVSKFASGILSDRSNPRYFMAFGLMMTGLFNIFFGLSSSIFMFALFWGLNGWFQGFGWPPCARFLTHWYSQSERGSWWSTWNVSHNVGAAIIPLIVGFCLQYFGWRYAMYVPGVICILGGFYLINRLRDTPQSLGLPPIEQFRNDYTGTTAKAKDEHELTAKQILWDFVLTNHYIWMLAAAYFFVYIVRTGINDWTALFLIESKGYSRWGANGTISMFEIGGFFGNLVAGWSSDFIFSAKRGPVNVIFAVGTLIAIACFWLLPGASSAYDSLYLFLIGFFVFGPQMLIGMCAAELSHKKAAATSTGFIGCFAYIGAACAGYPLGKITQDWGWESFFIAMVVCCVLSVLCLIPLWNAKENPRVTLAKRRQETLKEEMELEDVIG
jgi:MFS transporter, OPA family, sugar phosphate sensor protein UhpC